MPINTLIALGVLGLLIFGVTYLQINLSKSDKKWPGLVLPGLS